MRRNQRILMIFLGTLMLPFVCYGQEKVHQNYSLFHPVPRAQMRDMETDRPDVTESPYTVDAGHIQYETDFIRLVNENSEEQRTNTLLINQANLKIGLTGSTSIQIGFQTYGNQKETDIGSDITETTHGFGDVTFRIKQSILGNDEGNFAMALLPYVKFPTSKYDEDSRFEGGLIVPMQYKLPGEWNLGFQVEVDRLKDLDQQAMHTEFLQTLTLSHQLIKNIDGIAETYYTYDFKNHHFANFLNAAIQVEIAKDLKFDAGINYGIQHDAEKHYFFGASYRL